MNVTTNQGSGDFFCHRATSSNVFKGDGALACGGLRFELLWALARSSVVR